MSSGERSGIFIAYHYPEKRWLDRVVTALQQVVGDTPIDIWDDRKLLGGYAWRGELAETLARSKVAMMIVSDPFLLSGFVTRAKLPSLLDREREHGLKICWVLAGYCLFSVAGLRAEEAGNGINAALDGLSGTGRDAQIADIARKVAQILGSPTPEAAPAPAPAAAIAPVLETGRTSEAEEKVTASAEATPDPGSEPKRARRKRPSRNEPQALLPLLSEPEPAPPVAPPPPQPNLEFPAPKPQTHLPPAEPVEVAARAEPSPAPPVELAPTTPASLPIEPVATESARAIAPVSPAAESAEPPPARDLSSEAARGTSAEPPAEQPSPAPALAAPRVQTLPGSKPAKTPIVLPPMPPAPEPISTSSEPPPRRAESPLLPALDAVVDAKQSTIDTLRRLARWLKLAGLAVAALSLPAAMGMGLTHFLLIFGFALFLASLALFLHARIALLGQRLVGLRYTRSGLADELLPNRQREPLLRRAADILR